MFGTFIYIYGVFSIKHVEWSDLYIVLSLLMGIVISVTISGANLNPTITLSNVLKK
jgi:glycerol uptake facilitator-like aquaporin